MGGLVALSSLAVVGYYIGTVWQARVRTPALVRSMLASDHVMIQASDLSAWQKYALLSIYDPDFNEHSGTKRPFWKAFTHTTITQAVVKVLYFKHFKPGIRKIRQTLIARYALDPLVSKEDQLTLYINLLGFGQSPDGEKIFGFRDAARFYFDRSVAQLSEDQYLTMIAMLRAPGYFNPRTHPKENAQQVARLKRVISNCAKE